MSIQHSIGPIREAQRRLLQSAGRLLDADLHIWSPQLRLVLSTSAAIDRPPPAARTLLHRAAEQRRLVQGEADGRSAYAVPIAAPSRLHGVLTATLRGGRPAIADRRSQDDQGRDPVGDFLTELARVVADQLDVAAVEKMRSDRLAAADSELKLLRGITERLGDPADLRNAYRFILDEGRTAGGADLGLLALQESRLLLIARPAEPQAPASWMTTLMVRRLRDALGEHFDRGRERTYRGTLAPFLLGEADPPHPTQLIAVRLRLGNRRAGLLAYARAGHLSFTPREARLVEALAEQALLALRSGKLHANQSEFLLATVRALVSTVEAKDTYTSGHSARVHVLAMLLGREIGLPRRQFESLKWASILHDVGKIGLPEAILNKPGRLTPEEYEIVKEHPRRGYEVLQHIPQLRDASQAVLLHHERIDGHGYPLGVCGETIPLLARIIAVADTCDALTTTRPYRDACDMDTAYAEIRRVAGRQLDAEIVAALGRMLPFLREHRAMLTLPLGHSRRG